MGWMFEREGNESWYTCDDEYDTKQEAIEAGREWFREEDPDVDFFDVGLKEEPSIPKFHAYDMIDKLQDGMYEQCGEIADSWLSNVSQNDRAELERMVNQAVQEWVRESGNIPTFFTIVYIETVPMNPEL